MYDKQNQQQLTFKNIESVCFYISCRVLKQELHVILLLSLLKRKQKKLTLKLGSSYYI